MALCHRRRLPRERRQNSTHLTCLRISERESRGSYYEPRTIIFTTIKLKHFLMQSFKNVYMQCSKYFTNSMLQHNLEVKFGENVSIKNVARGGRGGRNDRSGAVRLTLSFKASGAVHLMGNFPPS